METNKIVVFVRIKPKESFNPHANAQIEFDDKYLSMGSKTYEFTKVFDNASQENIYEESRPFITNFMEGVDTSIILYGQTGSGKTYTIGLDCHNNNYNNYNNYNYFDLSSLSAKGRRT